jgi:Raf kinase inhibitor-like YbhB/YbcL family protein
MLEHVPSIVGEALKSVRPGLDKLVCNKDFAAVPETIAVESPAFGQGMTLPADYTEDGRKLSPPLTWRNVPAGTAAVALVVEDADSPTPAPLVHAIVTGLAGRDGSLEPGALKGPAGGGSLGQLGKNSYMKAEYLPPDPPSGHGPHRYAFQVFALRERPALEPTPGRSELVEAMRDNVLAKGVLVATYERP